MDDLSKKLFVQFDDNAPGVWRNAFELLREHMQQKTPPESFRGWIADLEESAENKATADALRQENATLTAGLAQHKAAIAVWEKAYAERGVELGKARANLAIASAIAWGRTTGRQLAAFIAVPVVLLIGWQAYERYWPIPARVDAGLTEIAGSSAWADGCGSAVVRDVGGAPYWVLLCGRTDTTSHLNAEGQPIGLHCLDLYATTAEADWKEYVKADPYALLGWWIKWPKRAVHCEPFEIKEAQR